MKKILLVLPVAVLFLAGCGNVSSSNSSNSNNSTGGSLSAKSSSAVKFSDQAYAKNAYLISADTLSADAKMALAGFQMSKKTLPDGSVQIDLKALESQYHDQSYTLKSGEQLYFIDKFLGDDQGEKEANIGDDTAAIVDASGNVVSGPNGF